MTPFTPEPMTTQRLLALLLLGLPVAASAQEGRIRYDHSVQYDFDFPQRPGAGGARAQQRPAAGRPQMPTGSASTMVLMFNAVESVMLTEPPEEEATAPSDVARRMAGFATRMRMASTSRSDHETLTAAYANNEDGTFTEILDFMGRTFLIRGETPTYEWRLVAEQSEFLGYMVQKATATQDSTTIEAWFTPEIPVSVGPGPYGGLPGMILVVSVDSGKELYSAIDIDLSGLEDGAIVPPEEGDEVSREEYEQIVEEKLEEIRSTRRRHR